MLKELLQGRVFGHPLHPILVHLPIGLFLLSFILDAAAMLTEPTSPAAFVRPSFYAMALAVITALLAAVPGIADYTEIRRDHPARQTANYHMMLNVAAVAIYLVNLAVRYRDLDDPRPHWLPLAMSLIGVGILSVSGYLGGTMVYDDGVGVGRHRRRTRLPRETIQIRRGDAVAESEIPEGASCRVSIDELVVAAAKMDGKVYAFQEFCTHRYGPLSEGSFDGTQVRCPWHGSCFDMRSGKVTGGPAEEDIRAFDVVVEAGKVRIRVTDEPQKSTVS